MRVGYRILGKIIVQHNYIYHKSNFQTITTKIRHNTTIHGKSLISKPQLQNQTMRWTSLVLWGGFEDDFAFF